MAEKKQEPQEEHATHAAHAAHATQQPAKLPKPRTTIGGKKIVATRASRQGDDGYQLSTLDEQVTVVFEDGTEKVVKSSDLFEPS